MKVLFAVNNDEISDAIVKRYQKDYKEILSYKNVYYFNAILKELQKDKTYDRVVISEDLEPFANNNYDTIDKFLFDKLDNISDEATDEEGNNTDIIIICTDRRSKSDNMLTKLFGIGIYSAIVGQDRSIEEVCKLINKPRTKKEAKIYYKIEVDNVNYQAEKEDSVSETEVQNILAHYKRLGKNEDKYVDSFNNIVSQYTDAQLKIIIRYLPISVKAVLEERSPKYQQLVSSNTRKSTKNANQYNQYNSNKLDKTVNQKGQEKIKVQMLEKASAKSKISKPIVIPSSVNSMQVKKLIKQETGIPKAVEKQLEELNELEKIPEDILDEIDLDAVIEEPKRGRGRPKKVDVDIEPAKQEEPKRGRGRPKKIVPENEEQEEQPKRGRGRPKKVTTEGQKDIDHEEDEELIDLFNIEDKLENEETVEGQAEQDEINLFDLDTDDENNEESEKLEKIENNEPKDNINEEIDLFALDNEEEENSQGNEFLNETNEMVETQYRPVSTDFSTILTKDKKVVCFVGTTKNGTSFIVNNVAHLLSTMGISTAILDMTKTRNAYYIYTNSEERLMKTAKESMYKLKSGIAEGVKINKNLTVYTSLPDDNNDYGNADNILTTLIKNYSVVLIDCDFDTPKEYFGAAQEVYLVQSMDVLTIQPLTAFLRDLQSKGVLKQEKLKIVINKGVNIKSVPVKTLIGGISKYNDPSMTYMKDLFDRDKVSYCIIPFEVQNYIKYLDSLITCSISLNGYTKSFMSALRQLGNMVYPLINKQVYSPRGEKYKDNFSTEMNDTLSKMKRKYQ